MSDKKNPDNKNAPDAEGKAPKSGEGQYQGIARRRFLGGLLTSSVASGMALGYTPATAEAAPQGFDPNCGDGDVPWDVNPFDNKAVVEAAEVMAKHSYSEEAARNIEDLKPIAERWLKDGARALTDDELAKVYELGWRPVSELNKDDKVRAQVNAALSFKDNIWGPKGDNQGDYVNPLPSASRARLTRFEAGMDVQAMAAIAIGILIVIIVVDFPTPAS